MNVPLNQINRPEGAAEATGAAPGPVQATGAAPDPAEATEGAPSQSLAVGLRLPLIVQFLKFGIVGISNTVIAFAIYTLLIKVFGVWYVAASGIGFAIGAVNGFLLNRRWTFKEHTGDALTPVRWAVVQSCGLGCNLGLVYLFVSGAGLDELVGQAFATVIVTVLTFAVNRSWTFRVRPDPAPQRAL